MISGGITQNTKGERQSILLTHLWTRTMPRTSRYSEDILTGIIVTLISLEVTNYYFVGFKAYTIGKIYARNCEYNQIPIVCEVMNPRRKLTTTTTLNQLYI